MTITSRANNFLDSLDDFYGENLTEAKKEEGEKKTDLNRKRDDLYKKISSFEKIAKSLEKVYNEVEKLDEEVYDYESPMVDGTDVCGLLKNIKADMTANIGRIERLKIKLEQWGEIKNTKEAQKPNTFKKKA